MNESDPLFALVYIFVVILGILFIYVLFRMLEIYMPRIIDLVKRITPKLDREFDELMDNLWSLVPGVEPREARVIKHEVHHHYGPQYHHADQAHHVSQTTNVSNTQNISDSVYYSKGERAGGTGWTGEPGRAGGIPGVGDPVMVGACRNCGGDLQAGWAVCPVCTHPIGSTEVSEHY